MEGHRSVAEWWSDLDISYRLVDLECFMGFYCCFFYRDDRHCGRGSSVSRDFVMVFILQSSPMLYRGQSQDLPLQALRLSEKLLLITAVQISLRLARRIGG